MTVYQVVFVLNPTKKQAHDEGSVATIIGQPIIVLATNDAMAAMKAYKQLPEGYDGKEDRIEAHLLPFRKSSG